MPITHTLLRYPGGKTRLLPFMMMLYQKNNLIDGHYVEPYVGGGGLGIALLKQGYVQHLHFNDLDPAIYAFWWSLINKNNEMIKLIENVKVDLEEWHKQKNIQIAGDTSDLLRLGFSTLFLNRTNVSGIINGGLIGGKNQTGKYKLDVRFNKATLIKKASFINHHKNKFSIYNEDSAKFLQNQITNLPEKTLINLDPPYYVKGKALYQNWYTHNNHVEIAKIIKNLKPLWIITYDNVKEIHDLYENYKRIEYNLPYSINKYTIGKEVIIIDPRIILPNRELVTNSLNITKTTSQNINF